MNTRIEDINWTTFAERVPAGCQVKFRSDYSHRMCYGVIEENKPYYFWDHWSQYGPLIFKGGLRFEGFQSETSNANRLNPFFVNPTKATYLIDGHWLTFAEVMA